MNRQIPDDVVKGRNTPTFTELSVPAGLLAAHQTSAWAELVVAEGDVQFVEEDSGWTAVARSNEPVVIIPGIAHHVVPGKGSKFYVQFYDSAETAAEGPGAVEAMPKDAGVEWRER